VRMKKFIVLVAAVMACVTLLASCAGGGASEP